MICLNAPQGKHSVTSASMVIQTSASAHFTAKTHLNVYIIGIEKLDSESRFLNTDCIMPRVKLCIACSSLPQACTIELSESVFMIGIHISICFPNPREAWKDPSGQTNKSTLHLSVKMIRIIYIWRMNMLENKLPPESKKYVLVKSTIPKKSPASKVFHSD